MALWHWNWMLAVDNSMTRHCRTNDRGQKTKDWAGMRFAFNSHHPLSSVFCPLSLNSHNCTIGAAMTPLHSALCIGRVTVV